MPSDPPKPEATMPPRLFFTSSSELAPHEHPDLHGIPYIEYLSLQEHKAELAKARADCKHPGCCCVCGHQGKCPECGPCAGISYAICD